MPAKKRAALRTGSLSPDDLAFIRASCRMMGPKEIAARLRRRPETIRRWIKDNIPPDQAEPEYALPEGVTWDQLNAEFDLTEARYFLETYQRLRGQFEKDDVLPTEDKQIQLACKFDILMGRNLKSKQKARQLAQAYEEQEVALRRRYGADREISPEDRAELFRLEASIQEAMGKSEALSTEFIKLEEKHQAILKDLKATREQRISRVESSKQSFLGIIKLLQDEEMRDHEGRQMELMKRATDKETRRLATPITYADGNQDQPLLSADTLALLAETTEDNDS